MKPLAPSLAAPLCAAALLLWLSAAPAAEPPASRNPADASASVPPARHVSALSGYRRHADEAVASWRAANENVNRIGGWRTYAREAAAAASAPSAAPAAAPAVRPASALPPSSPAPGPAHRH